MKHWIRLKLTFINCPFKTLNSGFQWLVYFFFGLVSTLLLSASCYSQSALQDSLRKALNQTNDAGMKVKLYHSISKDLLDKHFGQAQQYVDTLTSLVEKSSTPSSKAYLLNLKGLIAKESGKLSDALYEFSLEYQIRLNEKEPGLLAKTCNHLGGTYAELYKTDSAILYYLKALKIFEELKDYSNLASSYSNIGNLYNDQKLHDKAIQNLEKALAIRLEHGEEKKCMFTYNNLAVAYGTKADNSEEDLNKAIEYSNKGIAIALKYNNQYVAGVIDGGICHILIEKGKYQEAIPHCEQSVKVLTEAKRDVNLVFPLVNLTTIYNRLNQPKKSLEYGLKGYTIMETNHLIDPMEVYLEEIGKAYEQLGNHQEALIWFKKFMKLDDSLFRAENVKSLADVETKYQTEKKEKELIVERENNFKKTAWLIGLIITFSAFSLIGFLMYKRYQYKQEEKLKNAVIAEQQLGLNAVIEAQEAERKRIAKDLHDGIVQELVATKLGLESLQQQVSETEKFSKMNQLTHQLNDACTELRNISHLMMPPSLETKGLVPSLELLLRNSIHQDTIQTEFEYFNLQHPMDEKVELSLYRIAQELLNNILKHANASKIIMQLYQAGNYIILRIEDNGIGFDFNEAKRSGSMGLLNILSRVSTMGGNYFSEQADSSGTVSTIRIPI